MFIGVSAIVVKRAFFAWEAAVLPLNYARKPLIMRYNYNPSSQFPLSNPCQLTTQLGSYIAIRTPANALQEHDLGKVGSRVRSPFAPLHDLRR